MSAYPFHSVRPLTRALSSLVIILVLVIGFSLTAYGANPVEEMAKMGTTDPKGDSWQAIQNSLQQFVHPEFILRLFLSLSLAVACAYAIAWHPRRSSLMDPLSDLEEQKIDAERDLLVADLNNSIRAQIEWLDGFHTQLQGRNGGGDPWQTDGRLAIVVLPPGQAANSPTPKSLGPLP